MSQNVANLTIVHSLSLSHREVFVALANAAIIASTIPKFDIKWLNSANYIIQWMPESDEMKLWYMHAFKKNVFNSGG